LDICSDPPQLVTPLLTGPVCLLSHGRFEEPVRSWSLGGGKSRLKATSLELTKVKAKAYNHCIAPQAAYFNCRGAVHVTD